MRPYELRVTQSSNPRATARVRPSGPLPMRRTSIHTVAGAARNGPAGGARPSHFLQSATKCSSASGRPGV